MRAQHSLLFLLLACAPATATAAEAEPAGRLQVELQVGDVSQGVTAEVFVRGGAVGGQEPEPLAVRAPGSTEIALPAGLWRLEARAAGYWAKPAVAVVKAGTTQSARIRLWPTVTVSGRFLLPPNEPRPPSSRLRFQAPVAEPSAQAPLQANARPEVEEAEVACQVFVSNHFRCAVPVGVWHLRLWPAGYVAHYLWNVKVAEEGRIELGDLALQKGASVAGWVPTCRGEPAARCSVELEPQTGSLAMSAGARQTLNQRALSGRVEDRGFFQVQGVPAGSYVLEARQPGMAPRRLFPVLVVEGGVTELAEPVLLEPPLNLSIELSPAEDPWGGPWYVTLLGVGAAADRVETVVAEEAVTGGRWQRSGLAAGQYRLRVRDSQRNSWLGEQLQLERGQESFSFELPVVAVAGTVSLGEEPLPMARLRFEGIRIDVDEEGRFEGFLPFEGLWTVLVESREPRVKSYLPEVEVRRRNGELVAEVDLRLADTRLSGAVVNSEGEPVAGAVVLATSLVRAQRVLWERANDQGRFELRGLAAGEWWLQAQSDGEASERQAIAVQEAVANAPVRLQLKAQQVVAGRIVSPAGAVPGAVVYGYALNAFDPETAVSDGDGRFTLRLPKEQKRLRLAVLPPGFNLRTLDVPVTPGQPIEVAVHQDGGGALLIEGEIPASHGWPGDVVLLYHQGVPLAPLQLGQWAQMQGSQLLAGPETRVPGLEYGEYTVCRVPVEQAFAAMAGVGGGDCVGGYLAPGSELTLKLPPRPSGTKS